MLGLGLTGNHLIVIIKPAWTDIICQRTVYKVKAPMWGVKFLQNIAGVFVWFAYSPVVMMISYRISNVTGLCLLIKLNLRFISQLRSFADNFSLI